MNILLLDGGKDFGHSHGELNHTLHKKAKEVLTALGHNVQETVIDAGYDVEAEIEKFLWMDAVIWQMPGWWMHEPWTVKKYIDEVLTAGHGKLYHSDGRHRVNPTEGMENGDILQGQPTCYYYNYVNTEARNVAADVVNYMKYEAYHLHSGKPGT